MLRFAEQAGVAQLVERQLPKLNVVSSNLITRFLSVSFQRKQEIP